MTAGLETAVVGFQEQSDSRPSAVDGKTMDVAVAAAVAVWQTFAIQNFGVAEVDSEAAAVAEAASAGTEAVAAVEEELPAEEVPVEGVLVEGVFVVEAPAVEAAAEVDVAVAAAVAAVETDAPPPAVFAAEPVVADVA